MDELRAVVAADQELLRSAFGFLDLDASLGALGIDNPDTGGH
jgi:hypothetical protein